MSSIVNAGKLCLPSDRGLLSNLNGQRASFREMEGKVVEFLLELRNRHDSGVVCLPGKRLSRPCLCQNKVSGNGRLESLDHRLE